MISAEEVIEAVNIKEGLEYYGLEFNKKNFACCPFHREKTPSFSIKEDKNFFYCFGCGKGGNLINFVEEMFGLTFKEALKKICEDFNLEFNKKISPEKAKEQIEVSRALKIATQKIYEQKRHMETVYINEYRMWGKVLNKLEEGEHNEVIDIVKERLSELEAILSDEFLLREAYEEKYGERSYKKKRGAI